MNENKPNKGNIVTRWLTKIAKKEGFTVFSSLFGEFDFKNKKVERSSGSVYGIWISCDENISDKKIIEAADKFKKNDGPHNYAPLYWGTDSTPGHRIGIHFKTPNKTGGLNLIESEYKNMNLIYGVIYVSKYKDFEKLLHKKFKPLKGSDRIGRTPYTRIKY